MNAEDLRTAAREAESLARIVSYGPDKRRLLARAEDLLRQAEELDRRAGPRQQPGRRH
jgi:hypothetical protein